MNLPALRALILAQPDGSPVRLAYSQSRDVDLAGLLTAKTQRGPVPIGELSGYCLALGVTGGVLAMNGIAIGTDIFPGVLAMTLGIKTALNKYLTLVQNDYRLTTADVDDTDFGAGCDGMIGLGLLDAAGKTLLISLGANRWSLADVAGVTSTDPKDGKPTTITAEQVESARKGNT